MLFLITSLIVYIVKVYYTSFHIRFTFLIIFLSLFKHLNSSLTPSSFSPFKAHFIERYSSLNLVTVL